MYRLLCLLIPTLSWIIPPDPSGLFTQYQIWTSPTGVGFSLRRLLNSYAQTTFVHVPSNTSSQSYYYYVVTISSAGTATSTPSHTLKSIFLNMTGDQLVVASLNWNAMPYAFIVANILCNLYAFKRVSNRWTWTTIYTGNKLNYKNNYLPLQSI